MHVSLIPQTAYLNGNSSGLGVRKVEAVAAVVAAEREGVLAEIRLEGVRSVV